MSTLIIPRIRRAYFTPSGYGPCGHGRVFRKPAPAMSRLTRAVRREKVGTCMGDQTLPLPTRAQSRWIIVGSALTLASYGAVCVAVGVSHLSPLTETPFRIQVVIPQIILLLSALSTLATTLWVHVVKSTGISDRFARGFSFEAGDSRVVLRALVRAFSPSSFRRTARTAGWSETVVLATLVLLLGYAAATLIFVVVSQL